MGLVGVSWDWRFLLDNTSFSLQDQSTGKEEMWIVFQKMTYLYDAEEKKQFQPVEFPVNHSFKQYMEWKGYQEDAEIAKAEKKYGKNL